MPKNGPKWPKTAETVCAKVRKCVNCYFVSIVSKAGKRATATYAHNFRSIFGGQK